MANISNGYGSVLVERVGQDLKDFLQVVQKNAYYLLFDNVDSIEVDNNGNAQFTFSTGGRWNYETNLRGYLEGEWMNGEAEKKAYNKFIQAFEKKGGVVSVEYTDSDTAMDWMGSGAFDMFVEDEFKTVAFTHDFQEESITLERFAEQYEESTRWALEYIYGDEIADQYDKYAEKAGKKAVEPEVWFETIYEEEV